MVLDNTLISVLILILVGILVLVYFNWSNTREARRHTQRIFQQQRLVREVPDAHRLSQAVHLLRPSVRLGFDYFIEDEDGKLPHISEWNTGGTMPTQAEFDDALRRVGAIDSRGYAAMRRQEYPSIEEQLDAAFKARHGDSSEQEELDSRIAQIKSKYPKSDDEL